MDSFSYDEILDKEKKVNSEEGPDGKAFLLFFEPNEEQLKRWPFLSNLGGVLRHRRHPFLIGICDIFNRWKASAHLILITERFIKEAMDKDADDDISVFYKLFKKAEVGYVTMGAILDLLVIQGFSDDLRPGGRYFEEEQDKETELGVLKEMLLRQKE